METDWEYDEYDDEDMDDEDDFCPECQGTGRVPSRDYEAIQGFDYFACPDCERGLNSGYPWRKGT